MSIFAGSTRGGGVIERCTVFAKDARILLICLACHYALCLEMDLISKMKYKLLCCFFNYFFKCKKTQLQGEPMPKFSILFSHRSPIPIFRGFFRRRPPPLIRKRGEKISERTLDTFGDCPTTIWQTVIG